MALKDLAQLKREWIGGKITGESTQMSLDDMKRKYYIEQLGAANVAKSEHLDELEKRWLRKWIGDNGGSASATRYLSQLWYQAAVVLNKGVSRRMQENQQTFYANAG